MEDNDEESRFLSLKEGILEKKHPHTGYFHLRYVRLTETTLSWYEDVQGTLQRGVVSLTAIEKVSSVEYDACLFEMTIIDRNPIVFRCHNRKAANEWRNILNTFKGSGRIICSGVSEMELDEKPVFISKVEILKNIDVEYTTEKPYWGQCLVFNLHLDHYIRFSFSNGAHFQLSYSEIDHIANGVVEKEYHLVHDYQPQSITMSIEIAQETSLSPRNKIVKPSSPPIDLLGFINRQKFYLMGGVAVRIAIGYLTRGPLQVLLSNGLAVIGLGALFLSSESPSPLPVPVPFVFVLKRHQYTMDTYDDVEPEPKTVEDPIPQRFLNGCDGNQEEAKRRWEATCKWRQEQRGNF